MELVVRVEEISTDVFGASGILKTEPVKIMLRNDAEPHCVTSCRRIPLPILDKVQVELDRMEKIGIIRKMTEPTDWCGPIVPGIKKTVVLECTLTSRS